MKRDMIVIDGNRLNDALITRGLKMADVDRALGVKSSTHNWIRRNQIPAVVVSGLNNKCGIPFEEYKKTNLGSPIPNKDNTTAIFEIRYCPYCGRKIKEGK